MNITTARWIGVGFALTALSAIGCGDVTVSDGPDADVGQRGTGGHVLAEMGAGGRQEGAGGVVAQPGTGGEAPAGVGGMVVVAGTGGRTAGGLGGMTSVGGGGSGGVIKGTDGRPDYPACASTGQPPHTNGCGNASHQQSYLNGYACADCAETSAPPGYSGFVPPSPTVPPYACLTPDYVLCVVSCDLCR